MYTYRASKTETAPPCSSQRPRPSCSNASVVHTHTRNSQTLCPCARYATQATQKKASSLALIARCPAPPHVAFGDVFIPTRAQPVHHLQAFFPKISLLVYRAKTEVFGGVELFRREARRG
jgi:hypothetical protein